MTSLFKRLFVRPREAISAPDYLSRFGGFWTDTRGTRAELERLRREDVVDDEEARLLQFWIDNGYVVLPHVLDEPDVAAVQRAIDRAIDTGSRQMTYWDETGKQQGPARRDKLGAAECKVIDVHANLPEVQAAIFAPRLARFLELVMRSKAIAFQTLYFENGSEQGVHQDTAFVYVEPALEFMASWIALEDIQPGSGELMYYPGSHRLADALFGHPPGKALLPGDPAAPTYSAQLARRCESAGLTLEHFRPRRGDALIWAADLAHGGSARRGTHTRRSLVTHYCPLHRRPPYATGSLFAPTVLPNGHAILSQT